MDAKEYLKKPEGAVTLIGSGFLWAWLDSLFMSALFVTEESRRFLAETGMVLTFLCCAAALAVILVLRKPWRARIAEGTRSIIAGAVVGTLGSLCYIGAGLLGSNALLTVGGVATGIFMAVAEIRWGLVYCRDGARSATPYVAGGFACAPIIDLPLLFMIPEAQAAFFALAPIASGICLAFVVSKQPSSQAETGEAAQLPHAFRPRIFFHRYLGISAMLLLAVVLVMVGFGYLQHFISFSPPVEGGANEGVAIQIARGATAFALFTALLAKPRCASALYRIGFLVMIAGIMTMSFTFADAWFLVSGMLVIAGYTVFDLFMWVAFSHIARTRSQNAFKTVAVIRLFASLCAAVGCAGAMALGEIQPDGVQLAAQETTFVGYLIVIATVLLLSSDDVRVLLKSSQAPLPASAPSPEKTLEERLGLWEEEMRMTAREKEIASLLVQGRTQPRIAEMLGISENTVGTHVRHIYQKTGVHDRQQFIDLAISSVSPETHDTDDPFTETG